MAPAPVWSSERRRDAVFFPQTPAEHEAESGVKSKEARKYIFNCLDDMMQVRRPRPPGHAHVDRWAHLSSVHR